MGACFNFDMLHRKMNECIFFLKQMDMVSYETTPWCALCDVRIFSQPMLDRHVKEMDHCKKINKIYEHLISLLSPGIVLLEEWPNHPIYCILCVEYISTNMSLDRSLNDHVNKLKHINRVNEFHYQRKLRNLDFDKVFSSDKYEDIFIEKITRAACYQRSRFDPLYCWLCDCRLPQGESQFRFHTKGSSHMKAVEGQMLRLFEKTGLCCGIVYENKSFFCHTCSPDLRPYKIGDLYDVSEYTANPLHAMCTGNVGGQMSEFFSIFGVLLEQESRVLEI